MAGTTVSICNCKHEFQEKTYGKNRRLFNLTQSGDKGTCTVCGTIKNLK